MYLRVMRTTTAFAGWLLVLGVPGAVRAHDFWIEPDAFVLAGGARVSLRLRVGHGDDVKDVPRKPDRILRFEAVSPSGQPTLIEGQPGSSLAGAVTLRGGGTHIVVFRSNHAFIELEPKTFESYLVHEGLETIIERRRSRGEADQPGRESYARYAKALIRVGDDTTGFDRELGLPLEIVPVADPLRPGPVKLRVEFRDRPLSGARVDLLRLDDLDQGVAGRTDARGRVELDLPKPGRWMAALTHMVRAPKGVRGDWESYWATLTFERLSMPERTSAGPAATGPEVAD